MNGKQCNNVASIMAVASEMLKARYALLLQP